jgi:hypothetical protein
MKGTLTPMAGDTTGVLGSCESVLISSYPSDLPANHRRNSVVEPRGFDPWPPPCKVRVLMTSLLFAVVQKYLQANAFFMCTLRTCSS